MRMICGFSGGAPSASLAVTNQQRQDARLAGRVDEYP